jgi:hypothetical protein
MLYSFFLVVMNIFLSRPVEHTEVLSHNSILRCIPAESSSILLNLHLVLLIFVLLTTESRHKVKPLQQTTLNTAVSWHVRREVC